MGVLGEIALDRCKSKLQLLGIKIEQLNSFGLAYRDKSNPKLYRIARIIQNDKLLCSNKTYDKITILRNFIICRNSDTNRVEIYINGRQSSVIKELKGVSIREIYSIPNIIIVQSRKKWILVDEQGRTCDISEFRKQYEQQNLYSLVVVNINGKYQLTAEKEGWGRKVYAEVNKSTFTLTLI